ncbi:11329_t:CDS:2, partial [Scutellospora calospora]
PFIRLAARLGKAKQSLPDRLVFDAHVTVLLPAFFVLGLPLAAPPAHAQASAGMPAETRAHQRTADASRNTVTPRVNIVDTASVVLRATVKAGHAAERFGIAEVFPGTGVVAVTLAGESGRGDSLAAVKAGTLGRSNTAHPGNRSRVKACCAGSVGGLVVARQDTERRGQCDNTRVVAGQVIVGVHGQVAGNRRDGVEGICGRGGLNRRQGRGQRLIAVIGRAEGASMAGAVDTAQSSSCCASKRLTVASVAVDCVWDRGHCWRLAPVARVIFSFLLAARNDTAAVVVARVYWRVVLDFVVAGRAFLVLAASQSVPCLLLLATAPILLASFKASAAMAKTGRLSDDDAAMSLVFPSWAAGSECAAGKGDVRWIRGSRYTVVFWSEWCDVGVI